MLEVRGYCSWQISCVSRDPRVIEGDTICPMICTSQVTMYNNEASQFVTK